MAGDNEHCLQIHRVKTDGIFLPINDKNLKIEFIGDSITSAEGAIGAVIEEDWIPMWFSAVNNYTYLTSKILDAEYRVISQSGWGVLTSWDNNPMGALPPVYEKICGVVTGENNYKLGANSVYNFNLWQPDFVVINLGTNDYNALNLKKGWNKENLEEFKNGVSSFIEKVRFYNPKAYILWVYGILESSLFNEILEGINYYKTNSGDKRIEGFLLPEMTEKTKGSRFHPGVLAHKKASKALASKIKEII